MNRVVLYADGAIEFDNFHIYEVPIPDEFVETKGERKISVTLAYDPPVRHSRFDYLGATMSFRLIRGRSRDAVIESFRQRSKAEGKAETLTSTVYDCTMWPGPQLREGGTLQKADFVMKRNLSGYGQTYYLVLRCERKWTRDEHSPQRYAVVVSIEHTEQIDLYQRILQRVRARIRL